MNDLPFSSRLKEMLETGGLKHDHPISQARLSKELNITRQAISSYLNSATLPTIDKLKSLAEYFGVTSDYLIGLSDAKQPENSDIVERLGLSEDVIDILSDIKTESEKNREKFASDGLELLLMDIDIINRFIQYGSTIGLFSEISDVCLWMEHAISDKSEGDKDDKDNKTILEHIFTHSLERKKQVDMVRVMAEEYGYMIIDKDDFIEYKTFFVNEMYKTTLKEVMRPVEQPYLDYVNGVVDDGDD